MKINNLKINGFGKFENKEINLSENINLIYGKNEAGKTTLLKFISGMFYGISKNKNKKEIPDYEKYKPWKAEEYSGKIEYILDNKEAFEVFRDFNKKNPKIYKNSEDVSNEFNINKKKGNEFFYEQTNVDEPTFLSTTLVEQKNVVLDSEEQSGLIQKIANLLSTGEENISYKKTITQLSKRQTEEVGTLRTVGKPLNLLNEKIDKLTKIKENEKIDEEQKQELEKSKKTTKNMIEEKMNKLEIIKKINSKKIEENIQKEKIKINKDVLNEEKNKINHLKNKIKENETQKIKKNKINYLYVFILIIIILNLLLFISKTNKIIKIISGIISILFLIYLIISNNKINKLNSEKKLENNRYLLEIKSKEENIEKIENNINKINNENSEKNKYFNSQIKLEFNNKIEKNEIDDLLNENKEELEKLQENIEKEISSLKFKQHTEEFDYNNIIKKMEEKARIEEELQNILEEKKELLILEKEINIAKTAIERAYEKMKNEITPKFTKNLSNIVNKISNGKYNKIKFIDGEGLIVELENGEYVNANKLSIGTIDELYLSLRLSSMEEITKEKMPIILDEAFAYFDNQRLENILEFINNNLKENQVIIFTCSNREKDILNKNNIKYNYIEI